MNPASRWLATAMLGGVNVLVSRWDAGLPAPVVASSRGRQVKLDSATDPRLMQFIQAFTGRGPESAPC